MKLSNLKLGQAILVKAGKNGIEFWHPTGTLFPNESKESSVMELGIDKTGPDLNQLKLGESKLAPSNSQTK